jgi:hypothetical protein
MTEPIQTGQPDQRLEYLLNGSIDGELNKAEEAELNGLLSGSEKAREFNEEFKAFASVMDEIPDREPPAYLQSSIERQIRLPVAENDAGIKRGFPGGWLPAHWMKTGFAIAAGAVLTIGVYEMGKRPMTAEEASNLVGTMVKNQVTGQGEVISSLDISTENLSGLVALRNEGRLYTLDIRLNPGEVTRVNVDFAERGLELKDMTGMPKGNTQDSRNQVPIDSVLINISNGDEQFYSLAFEETGELKDRVHKPLLLQFFRNDTLIHEAELAVSRP